MRRLSTSKSETLGCAKRRILGNYNQKSNQEVETGKKEEMCAEDWNHQEDDGVQESLHEDGKGSGTRKSLGISTPGYGTNTKEKCEDMWPAQQGRNLQSRSHSTWRSTISKLSTPTCFWAQAVWTSKWEDDMRDVWKRQVWEATSWTKVRGPAGAVLCEMKDLGITAPSWQVLRLGGRMISVKDTCPEDINQTLTRHANDVYWLKWAKKHDIEEVQGGVWFGQSHVEKKAE